MCHKCLHYLYIYIYILRRENILKIFSFYFLILTFELDESASGEKYRMDAEAYMYIVQLHIITTGRSVAAIISCELLEFRYVHMVIFVNKIMSGKYDFRFKLDLPIYTYGTLELDSQWQKAIIIQFRLIPIMYVGYVYKLESLLLRVYRIEMRHTPASIR